MSGPADADRPGTDPTVDGEAGLPSPRPRGLSPQQRSLRARLAAHAMHARHDGRRVTANARKAFLDRFEHEVDPDGVLPAEERRRRADHARRAHMTRLALRSARSRAAGGGAGRAGGHR